jgi:hypothetical protein
MCSILQRYTLSVFLLIVAPFISDGQPSVSNNRLLVDIGYSIHGSGDFEGGHGGFGYQHNLKKWFSMQYQIQFTTHSGSEIGYVRQTSDIFTNSVPLYSVISGIQLGILPTLHVLGHQKQWLNVIVGPYVRFQINGSPDSYAYYNNTGTSQPDYYVIKSTQPKVWTVGYFIALESQLLHRPKWSLGIRVQTQNDTNGDSISGFGLVWQRNLLQSQPTKTH